MDNWTLRLCETSVKFCQLSVLTPELGIYKYSALLFKMWNDERGRLIYFPVPRSSRRKSIYLKSQYMINARRYRGISWCKHYNLVWQHAWHGKQAFGKVIERILSTGCLKKKVYSSFLGKSKCLLKFTSFRLHNAQTLLHHLTKFHNYWTYTNHTTTSPGANVGLAENRHV